MGRTMENPRSDRSVAVADILRRRVCVRRALLIVVYCAVLAQAVDLPWLRTEGEWLKDPAGNNVVLRGLNTVDPEDLHIRRGSAGYKPIIDRVAALNARVVRLPIHDWALDGYSDGNFEAYYTGYLRPIVDYCREKGLYCIVDNHYIGRWGGSTVTNNSRNFWSYFAAKFKSDSHVLFEIMNEPTQDESGRDDWSLSLWNAWKAYAQQFVDLIRGHAPDNIILINSPHWSQYTRFASESPFEGSNLVYVMHCYPTWSNGKSESGRYAQWDELFGNAADKVPVFVAEFGYGNYDYCKGHEYEGTTSGFGVPFRNYLDNHKPNVNWTGWVYDYAYHPWMVDQSWNLTSGEDYQGQFLADWLYDKRNEDQPESGPAVSTIAIGMRRDPSLRSSPRRDERMPSVTRGHEGLAIECKAPGILDIYSIGGTLLSRRRVGGPTRVPLKNAGIVVVTFREADGVGYAWTLW